MIARAGVDVVQLDKPPADQLQYLVREIRGLGNNVKVAAAGGIHDADIAKYAATGIDIAVCRRSISASPPTSAQCLLSCNMPYNPPPW